MLLEILLGIVTIGSATIIGAAITTKEKDNIIQPVSINNNINNSINNSFNTHKFSSVNQNKTASTNDKINNTIKDSFNSKKDISKDKVFSSNINNKQSYTSTDTNTSINTDSHNQQNAEIDHDKIIDELYARYKLDKCEENLNELLDKLHNL